MRRILVACPCLDSSYRSYVSEKDKRRDDHNDTAEDGPPYISFPLEGPRAQAVKLLKQFDPIEHKHLDGEAKTDKLSVKKSSAHVFPLSM